MPIPGAGEATPNGVKAGAATPKPGCMPGITGAAAATPGKGLPGAGTPVAAGNGEPKPGCWPNGTAPGAAII